LTKALNQHCRIIGSCRPKVRDSEIRKQENLLSNYAGHHGKILPKRTHSMDAYVRIVADVFVNGRYVEEILRAEGYAKPGRANGIWPMTNGQPGDSAR
jgi:endonuclease YncB( thermonuclease family)